MKYRIRHMYSLHGLTGQPMIMWAVERKPLFRKWEIVETYEREKHAEAALELYRRREK